MKDEKWKKIIKIIWIIAVIMIAFSIMILGWIFIPVIAKVIILAVIIIFCITSVRFVPSREVWIINRLNQPRLKVIDRLVQTSIVTKLKATTTKPDRKFNFFRSFDRMVIIIPKIDHIENRMRLDMQKMNLDPLPVYTKDGILILANTFAYYYIMDVLNAEYLTADLREHLMFQAKAVLPEVMSTIDLMDASKSIPKINYLFEEKISNFNLNTLGIECKQFALEDFKYPKEIQERLEEHFKEKQANEERIMKAETQLKEEQLKAEAARVRADAEKYNLGIYSDIEWNAVIEAAYKLKQTEAIANSQNSKMIISGGGKMDFLTGTEVIASRLEEGRTKKAPSDAETETETSTSTPAPADA